MIQSRSNNFLFVAVVGVDTYFIVRFIRLHSDGARLTMDDARVKGTCNCKEDVVHERDDRLATQIMRRIDHTDRARYSTN
jgi:predicted ATPase with chaperone activity